MKSVSIDHRLTSGVKKKTFLISEKNYLWNYLVAESPEANEINEAETELKNYVIDLIIEYLIPNDLKDLIKKSNPNLIDAENKFCISGDVFGLGESSSVEITLDSDSSETNKSTIQKVDSLVVVYLSNEEKSKYLIPRWQISDLSNKLIKEIPETKLITLKDILTKCYISKAKFNDHIGRYKNPSWYGGAFKNINTWGALYKLNSDWFTIVYNKFINTTNLLSLSKEDNEEEVKKNIIIDVESILK